MTPPGLVVDLRTIGPAVDESWTDRFLYLLNEFRNDYGPVIWTAPAGISRIDSLFLFYQPGHHAEIDADRLLEKLLSAMSYRVEAVYVFACGRSPRDGQVSEREVSMLVSDQCAASFVHTGTGRILRPEELDSRLSQFLNRRLNWTKMQPPSQLTAQAINERLVETTVTGERSMHDLEGL